MRRWLAVGMAAVTAVLAIGVFAGRGPAAAFCLGGTSQTSYDRFPEPAPPLDDGDVLGVGDQNGVFVGVGRRLDVGYRLRIRGGRVLEQVDTEFAETERRCGTIEGYRFVIVRAVAPGDATVTDSVDDEHELRVRVVDG